MPNGKFERPPEIRPEGIKKEEKVEGKLEKRDLLERSEALQKVLYPQEEGKIQQWVKENIFGHTRVPEERDKKISESGYDSEYIKNLGQEMKEEYVDKYGGGLAAPENPAEKERFERLQNLVQTKLEGDRVMYHSAEIVGMSAELSRQARKAMSAALEKSPEFREKTMATPDVRVTPDQIRQYVTGRHTNTEQMIQREKELLDGITIKGEIPKETEMKRKQYKTAFALIRQKAFYGEQKPEERRKPPETRLERA